MSNPATIIRPEVFGSKELKEFAKLMGWTERDALGALALLWNGSQKRKVVNATARQIGHWCETADAAETSKLVAALSDELVGFAKKVDGDLYAIAGNEKEVAKLRTWNASAKKGGKKTREKWQDKKGQSNQEQDAEPQGTPSATPGATLSSSLLSSILVSSNLPSSCENSVHTEPQSIHSDSHDPILEHARKENEKLLAARKRLEKNQEEGSGFFAFGKLGFRT